jgi:plastocyanin
MKRPILGLGLSLAAILLAACSTASGTTPTSAPAGSPAADTGLTIVAKDIKFQPTELAVPADEPFALTMDNQEAAPHNIAISDASGASVFKGEIVSSQAITYQIPALAAGSYPFICEVHPNMTGTLTAS